MTAYLREPGPADYLGGSYLPGRYLSARTAAGLAAITDGASFSAAMGGFGVPNVALIKFDEALNAPDLSGAGNNFTEQGTPTREVTVAGFNDLLTTMTGNSTDALAAAASTVWNPASTSVLAVFVGRILTMGNFMVWGKRDPIAPNRGAELRGVTSPSNRLRYLYSTATGLHSRDLVGEFTEPVVLATLTDYANNVNGIISTEGSSTGGTLAAGSGDSTAIVAAGNQRLPAINAHHGLLALYDGAPAEGYTVTFLNALADFLSI